MRNYLITLAVAFATTGYAGTALADPASDTKYCKDLAAQWNKYRAGSGSSYGGTVAEQHMLDCTRPSEQIPQIKKALSDSGHAVHDGSPLTLEQRVDALEKKVK